MLFFFQIFLSAISHLLTVDHDVFYRDALFRLLTFLFYIKMNRIKKGVLLFVPLTLPFRFGQEICLIVAALYVNCSRIRIQA